MLDLRRRTTEYPDGRPARGCGIVTMRQQPGAAKGVVFLTMEDETGVVNVIVWRDVRDRHRQALLGALLLAYGVWQRQGDVKRLAAGRLEVATPLLGRLGHRDRDLH